MPVIGFLSTLLRRLLGHLATESLLVLTMLFIQYYTSHTPLNGGNVMHNNAAFILVIAPPDAGFQGVGGIGGLLHAAGRLLPAWLRWRR